MYEAVVTIDEEQWTVSVASGTFELISGLSNLEEMPEGIGMLFDMGSDRDYIRIDMDDMLFPLDIVFINSKYGVVGVIRNAQPLEAIAFEAGSGYGARYFMEVNAGELVDIDAGNNVVIGSSNVQPTFWGALITGVMAVSQIAIIGATTYGTVKKELKKDDRGGGQ